MRQVDTSKIQDKEKHAALTGVIIGAAFRVHDNLGPGFPESIYLRALTLELSRLSLNAAIHPAPKVTYEGCIIGDFLSNMLIEETVIVERKAVQSIAIAHEVQTVNYLTATGMEVGLLINCGAPRLEFKRKHPGSNSRYRPLARKIHNPLVNETTVCDPI
jgi:GxxExxY protein